MKVGFIGLGNVGGKLAGSLLRNGMDLSVLDLDEGLVAGFVARGAKDGGSPAAMMRACDVVITCLPSPAASAAVVAGECCPRWGRARRGWRCPRPTPTRCCALARWVAETGGLAVECPRLGAAVTARTPAISPSSRAARAPAVEHVMPLLVHLGRQILHTGDLGSASKLKVMTNYLATVNLLSLCEALTTMKAAGLDLATTYEAIRISSGNSFVHETESQLILSGSRDVNFTMDLVQKDIGLFQKLATDAGVPLEISPLIIEIMSDGQRRYGLRAQSDRIIERLEEATGLSILADGFPTELVDDEPEGLGAEVIRSR